MSGVASLVQNIIDQDATTTGPKKIVNTPQVRSINGFEIGGVLGKGGFSQVYSGFDRETNKRVALKCMFHNPMVQSQQKQIDAEVEAMDLIKHKNVIRLHDYDKNAKFPEKDGTTKDTILVVLELATGGELFDYLMYTGKFSEKLTRSYFRQLIEGMEACHNVGVAHRDLKPENLLLDENMVLKLADFGFASVFKSDEGRQFMITECGTRAYMAPEILSGQKYTEKTDIWAAGIICFIMIAGFPPLQQATGQDWWFDKLRAKKHNLFWAAHTRTAQFSESAKDFIVKLLCAEPTDRLSLEQIKAHKWYNEEVFTDQECKSQLLNRKAVVDRAKQEEQQDQKKVKIAHRAIGGDGGTDALPMTSPNMTSGKILEEMVEEGVFGDWATTPPKYDDKTHIKVCTEFITEENAKALLTRIASAVKKLQGKVYLDRAAYTMKGEVKTQLGVLTFNVEVEDMGKGLSNACFRRIGGNPLNFIKLYEDNLLKDVIDCKMIE